MNKCILIGNVVRDPELTTTGSGISVCKFSIAVNRTYKNANGEQETDFLNIVTWRGLADNCSRYLKKGSKVAVCGQIQNRTWEVDGQKRYATDIVADDVEFLSSARNDGENGQQGAQSSKPKGAHNLKPVGDEGLPF